MTWRRGWTPLVLALVAMVWTWPAVRSPTLLGHYPDAAGTAWFIAAAPRLAASLHDVATGWPAGVTYGRPDSWTLLALGALLDNGVPSHQVHALVGFFGVFVSAWAAEGFARALGARAPWSLIAGIAYACSGLASTAWIEGYVYHLADPWLPMLGWAWWRATAPDGRALHGVAAGLAFVLTVATTAWHGLAGGVVVAGILAGARWQGAVRPGPVLAALGTVALPMTLYLARFLDGGGADLAADNGLPATDLLAHFRMNLLLHAMPGPSVDVSGHAQTAWVSSVVIALAAASPVVLAGERAWRPIGVAALAALGLALYPWAPPAWATALPEGARAGIDALAAALLRFPERFGWGWALCGGVIAARVATVLGDRVGRFALPLLLLVVVDTFVATRLPFRQHGAPAEAPAAYGASEGPVLDLWPEDIGREPAWTLRTTNTGCYYQAVHGRPIADHCVMTPGEESPRVRLGRWVAGKLLAGEVDTVRDRLSAFGFTTLAVHPDLFHPGDRARLGRALASLDPEPTASVDGGDHVVAYRIPWAMGADVARAAWVVWAEGPR